MIGKEEVADRRTAARAAARGVGLDALLVVGHSFYDRCGDIAWLTNHFPPFPACVFDMPGVTRQLAEGMVLCVEPAVMIPDVVGCSIEQEIAVTPQGGRILTEPPVVWW